MPRGTSNSAKGHNCLCQTIVEELNHQGFATVLEKWLETDDQACGDVIVDIYATRDDETLIVECGYCPLQKLNRLVKVADRVVHIPYITQWCPYDPFPARRKAYEEQVRTEKYDFRDYLMR